MQSLLEQVSWCCKWYRTLIHVATVSSVTAHTYQLAVTFVLRKWRTQFLTTVCTNTIPALILSSAVITISWLTVEDYWSLLLSNLNMSYLCTWKYSKKQERIHQNQSWTCCPYLLLYYGTELSRTGWLVVQWEGLVARCGNYSCMFSPSICVVSHKFWVLLSRHNTTSMATFEGEEPCCKTSRVADS